MTGDKQSRFSPAGILSLMFTLLLLSGCIAENTDDCYKGVPVKVNLPGGIPSEAIKDINLYVFDDKDLLLDILAVNGSNPVMLNYPGIPSLHCVAWCNTQDGTMLVSPLSVGDSRSNGFISLKPSVPTRAEQSIYTSPTDLFYGELNVDNTSTSYRIEQQEMTVSRLVASMNITLRGLELLSGSDDGNYSIVVHETTSRIDFAGRYGGPLASYAFAAGVEAGRDFIVPTFNLFPTIGDSGLAIDIYHNSSLLRRITVDDNNRPMIPIVGKTLNVLVNFKLNVSVQIEITGWGEQYIWKEYS